MAASSTAPSVVCVKHAVMPEMLQIDLHTLQSSIMCAYPCIETSFPDCFSVASFLDLLLPYS